MNDDLILDLGFAVDRGDVGLWIGFNGLRPDELALRQPWLALWTEERDDPFPEAMESAWRNQSWPRMVVEVPDLVEDALGDRFKFADFCPCFYLNGKGAGPERLSRIRRGDSRRDKIKYLEKLGASVLLICGYSDIRSCAALLEGEVGEYGAALRLIVLADCSVEAVGDLQALLAKSRPSLATKIRAFHGSVMDLLFQIESKRTALPAEPTIRFGSVSIPLRPLLRTQPPIDQEFVILSEQDIRSADPGENKQQLLTNLLAGGMTPWRTFAHGVEWTGHAAVHLQKLLEALDRMQRDDLSVSCLNVPAESGAGLTVLLQRFGFAAACRGYPCLFHRPFGSNLNYDLLRKFLTDLQVTAVADKGVPALPVVLIFDVPSVEADSQEVLRDLPVRLARDGRRVLVVRGISVRPNQDSKESQFRQNYGVRILSRGKVNEYWLPTISAELTQEEQNDLASWAAKHFTQPSSVGAWETLQNWDQNQQRAPLLICLYFILAEEFRAKANLGKHLVDRLKMILPPEHLPSTSVVDGRAIPLTREQLQTALGMPNALGPHFENYENPERHEIASVFMSLSALGCLRVGAPRDVLSVISGIAPERVHAVISFLEKHGFLLTDIPLGSQLSESSKGTNQPLGAIAFYNYKETVGLCHPDYGRLILEWLRSPDGLPDRQLLGNSHQASAFLRAGSGETSDVAKRFRLLEPLLRSLGPTRSQADFAAEISVRFLRLQKREMKDQIAAFLWQHKQLALEAFSWMKPSVVLQSPVTLHSRGITRYKNCFQNLSLAECRQLYQDAETDLKRAIDDARETQESEHPANIITSLGLLYLFWADRERQEGMTQDWLRLNGLVEATLRQSLLERRDNTFAACGLAKHLLDRCERLLGEDKSRFEDGGRDLAEALELLQIEPEAYFTADWNDLWIRAVSLLRDDDSAELIANLKRSGNELGYALDALKALAGRIPTEPTADPGEVKELRDATRILHEAQSNVIRKPTALADLLRYAVFSAYPERIDKPSFDERFKLLEKLKGTRYLDQPIWRFDYAMLAFQTRHYVEGAESFVWLRQGAKFFEVPMERGQILTESPQSLKAMLVRFKVLSRGAESERGTGRVEHPVKFRDPIPFSARSFQSRGKNLSPGMITTCYIRLNPAGPFAEPVPR